MNTVLEEQLKKIDSVLDTDKLLHEENSSSVIQNYYRVNKLAYRIFHNSKGYLHMGLSTDGKYEPSDLEKPLLDIEAIIHKTAAQKVLELASGHGANSLFLAKRNPNVTFHALDLSTKPKKGFSRLDNTSFTTGDFHNLSKFDDNSLDLVFIIEALCYASDKEKVIGEVARVLRKGGRFIILDGYYSKLLYELDATEQKAAKLTSNGMAVGEFKYIEEFNKIIASSSLEIIEQEDLSNEVLPTMTRLSRFAKLFYKLGFIAKLLKIILPDMFVRNSVSGLLMPTLMKQGIAKYCRHELVKK